MKLQALVWGLVVGRSLRQLSGQLVLFWLLICMLVTQMSFVCENSLSYDALMMHELFYMLLK